VKGKSLFSGVSGRSRIPIEFHLEAGHLLYFYYESAMARDYFDTALKLSGLDIHLTGQTVAMSPSICLMMAYVLLCLISVFLFKPF